MEKEIKKATKIERGKLYRRLAKDAEQIADRQARYAEMALREKKFADADARKAHARGDIYQEADSLAEAGICREFHRYRMGLSQRYRKTADTMRGKARRGGR